MTREEAIEELKKMYASSVMIFGTKNDKETQEALKKAIDALRERPHGEWIFKNGKYRCTACGEKAIYRYNGMSNIPKEILTDFCYNCGSDNRKRGETE